MFLGWKSISGNGVDSVGFSVETDRIFLLCEEREQNGEYAHVPSSWLCSIQSFRHGTGFAQWFLSPAPIAFGALSSGISTCPRLTSYHSAQSRNKTFHCRALITFSRELHPFF